MKDQLIDQLKRHEGWVPHTYQDHLGYWTIGYGRLVDRSRGGGLTQEEGEVLLRNDVERVMRQVAERVPFYHRLSPVRQQALCNMAFQLGVNGMLNFRRMLAAMESGDFDAAAREALDSRWATQTPNRAREIATMIETGERV